MTPLEVRRVMAEAAGVGAVRADQYGPTMERAVKAAVADATRVRVDNALIQAYRPGVVPGSVVWTRVRNRLVRVFEAAGFEVDT